LAVALEEEKALLDEDSPDTFRVDHVSREVDRLFDLFKAIDLYNYFCLLKEMIRDGFLRRRLGLQRKRSLNHHFGSLTDPEPSTARGGEMGKMGER